MTKTKFTLTTLAVVLLTAAASAQATTLRAFVSSTGNDANAATNCAQTAPCRTFAAAYPTVTAGGELIALDTAGYGPLTGGNTINKAITIATVPGATAFVVVATGTTGFNIAAGPTDLIILRNINFNGSNAASTTGITLTSGRLHAESCKLAQLTTGISITNAKANLSDCIVTGNTTGASVNGSGWDLNAASTPAVALLTLVRGDVIFNTTALVATNPGSSKVNIWVLGPAGFTWYTNFAHNSTLMTASGTGCPCGPPVFPGTYTGQGNNGSPQ
jgi:hypothetical protein